MACCLKQGGELLWDENRQIIPSTSSASHSKTINTRKCVSKRTTDWLIVNLPGWCFETITPTLSLPFRASAWRLPAPSPPLLPRRQRFPPVESHLPTRPLPSPDAPLLRVYTSRPPLHLRSPFSAPLLSSVPWRARRSATSSQPAMTLSRQLSLLDVYLQVGAHRQRS